MAEEPKKRKRRRRNASSNDDRGPVPQPDVAPYHREQPRALKSDSSTQLIDCHHSRPYSSIKKRHSTDDPKFQEQETDAIVPPEYEVKSKSKSSQTSMKTDCHPSRPCSSYMKRQSRDDSDLDQLKKHKPGSKPSAKHAASNLDASISSKPRRKRKPTATMKNSDVPCATSPIDHKMPLTASKPEASAQQIGLNHSWPSSAFAMRHSSYADYNANSDTSVSHLSVTPSEYGSIETASSFPKQPKVCHPQKSKLDLPKNETSICKASDAVTNQCDSEKPVSPQKKIKTSETEWSEASASALISASKADGCSSKAKGSKRSTKVSSDSSISSIKPSKPHSDSQMGPATVNSSRKPVSTQEKKQGPHPISVSKVNGCSTQANKSSKPVAPFRNDSRKPQSFPSTNKFDSEHSSEMSSREPILENKSSASLLASSVSRQEGGSSQATKLATAPTATTSKAKDCSSQVKKCTPKRPHKVMASKTSNPQSSHLHTSEPMLSKKSSKNHEALASPASVDGSSSQVKSIKHASYDAPPQTQPLAECHSKKPTSSKKKKRSKQYEASANSVSLQPIGSSKIQVCSSKPVSIDGSENSPQAKKASSSQVKVTQPTSESTRSTINPASNALPISISNIGTGSSQTSSNQAALSSKQIVSTSLESSGARESQGSLLNSETEVIKPNHCPSSQINAKVTLSQTNSIMSSLSPAESSNILPKTGSAVNPLIQNSHSSQTGSSKNSLSKTDLKTQCPDTRKKTQFESVASKNPLYSYQTASCESTQPQAASKVNPLSRTDISLSENCSKSSPLSQTDANKNSLSQANFTNVHQSQTDSRESEARNLVSQISNQVSLVDSITNPDSTKSSLSQANSNSQKFQTDFSKKSTSKASANDQAAYSKNTLRQTNSKMGPLSQDSSKPKGESALNPLLQTGGQINPLSQTDSSKNTLFCVTPLSQSQTDSTIHALFQAYSKVQCQSETDASKGPLFQASSSDTSGPLSQTDSETTSLSQTDSSRTTFSQPNSTVDPMDFSRLSQVDCCENSEAESSLSQTDSSEISVDLEEPVPLFQAESSNNLLFHADSYKNPFSLADFETDLSFQSKSRMRLPSQTNSGTSPPSQKDSRQNTSLLHSTTEASNSYIRETNFSTISTNRVSPLDSGTKPTESGMKPLTSTTAHSEAKLHDSNAEKFCFRPDYSKKPLLQTHIISMPVPQTDFSTKKGPSLRMKNRFRCFTEELECMKAVYTTRCKQEVRRLRAKQKKKKLTFNSPASLGLGEALIQWKEGPRMIQESIAESQKTLEVFMQYYSKVTEELEKFKADGNSSINTLSSFDREFIREVRRCNVRLPIYAHRLDIMKMVEQKQVSIVIGETGSGKSTQLVQYLYEAGYSSKGLIACTQPRKLAAISLAEHVSREVSEVVGKTYGYITTKDRHHDHAPVIYMTDYTLLNECIADPKLSKYSCLVIDEAHERSIHTDILIALIKRCLPNRPDLKVIITSATINPTLFSHYFGGCPIVEVPGRMFPVWVEWGENWFNGQDYVAEAVIKVCEIYWHRPPGHILVFLTCAAEIDRACKLAQSKLRYEALVLPLHGKLQPEDQRKVFDTSTERRKVIFSTNVAETSVTIPGVVYVIDTGLSKEMCYNPEKNMNTLEIRPISKSSADQRKGRAGRTCPGECYRLYSERDYASLRDDSTPEILRTTLSYAVIKLYEFGIEDVCSFEFVESPDRKALEDAIANLKFLGAIEDDNLTDLGVDMALLPLEPNLSKVLLDGVSKDIGMEAMAAVAISTLAGRVFFRPASDEMQEESDRKMLSFCQQTGDQMTYLHAYFQWSLQNKIHRTQWCVNNFINVKSMKMVQHVIDELQITLQKCGIFIGESIRSLHAADWLLPKIFFQSFMQNICVHLGHNAVGYWSANHPDEQLLVHPSSSLLQLSSVPRCVVYERTQKTTQHFLLQALPVREEWIQEAIKSGKLASHPADNPLCLPYKVYPLSFNNLGRRVMLKLCEKYPRDRRKIVPEFAAFEILPVFEYLNDQGILKVFSQKQHHKKISQCVSDYIETCRNELRDEYYTCGLTSSTDDVQISIGLGGCIRYVLMPEDFQTVVVRGLYFHKDLEKAEQELRQYGKCTARVTRKKNAQLFLRYQDPVAAQRALNHQFDCFPDSKVKIQHWKEQDRTHFCLKVEWWRRPRHDYAYINFHETDFERCFDVSHLKKMPRRPMMLNPENMNHEDPNPDSSSPNLDGENPGRVLDNSNPECSNGENQNTAEVESSNPEHLEHLNSSCIDLSNSPSNGSNLGQFCHENFNQESLGPAKSGAKSLYNTENSGSSSKSNSKVNSNPDHSTPNAGHRSASPNLNSDLNPNPDNASLKSSKSIHDGSDSKHSENFHANLNPDVNPEIERERVNFGANSQSSNLNSESVVPDEMSFNLNSNLQGSPESESSDRINPDGPNPEKIIPENESDSLCPDDSDLMKNLEQLRPMPRITRVVDGQTGLLFVLQHERNSVKVAGILNTESEEFIKARLYEIFPLSKTVKFTVFFLYSEAFEETDEIFSKQRDQLISHLTECAPQSEYCVDFRRPFTNKTVSYRALLYFTDSALCSKMYTHMSEKLLEIEEVEESSEDEEEESGSDNDGFDVAISSDEDYPYVCGFLKLCERDLQEVQRPVSDDGNDDLDCCDFVRDFLNLCERDIEDDNASEASSDDDFPEQFMYRVKMSLSSSTRYTRKMFSVIKPSVQEISYSFAKATPPVTIEYTRQDEWGNTFVEVKSSDMSTFTEAKAKIAAAVQPDMILLEDDRNRQYVSTSSFRNVTDKIQAQTSTYIKICGSSLSTDSIAIYGTKENREIAKNEIEKHLQAVLQGGISSYEINLKTYRPGMMKYLVEEYGCNIAKLPSVKNGIAAARISPRQQTLTLFANEAGYNFFLGILDSFRPKFISEQAQLHSSSDLVMKCCVCFECHDSKQRKTYYYRLEGCGHVYCRECIEQQLEPSSIVFPARCAAVDCEEQLVWRDFENLFKDEVIKLRDITSASLKTYLAQNSKTVKSCITPNCDMVYVVSEVGKRFVCSHCGESMCTKCHSNWHEGFSTCVEYQNRTCGEVELMEWMKADPKNRKKCPNCCAPIEKNKGCQHMACTQCKRHICWFCLAYFDKQGECYAHLSAMHGGAFGRAPAA